MDGVVPVAMLIRQRRLLYLRRVLCHAPRMLRALIQWHADCRGSWSQLVVEDLVWLRTQSDELKDSPYPTTNFVWWESYICGPGRRWKSVVRKCIKAVADNSSPAYAGTTCVDKKQKAQGCEEPDEFLCPLCDYTAENEKVAKGSIKEHKKSRT